MNESEIIITIFAGLGVLVVIFVVAIADTWLINKTKHEWLIFPIAALESALLTYVIVKIFGG